MISSTNFLIDAYQSESVTAKGLPDRESQRKITVTGCYGPGRSESRGLDSREVLLRVSRSWAISMLLGENPYDIKPDPPGSRRSFFPIRRKKRFLKDLTEIIEKGQAVETRREGGPRRDMTPPMMNGELKRFDSLGV